MMQPLYKWCYVDNNFRYNSVAFHFMLTCELKKFPDIYPRIENSILLEIILLGDLSIYFQI